MLPVAGGIYDQRPELIEAWDYIFSEKAKHEKAEADKQKREAKKSHRR